MPEIIAIPAMATPAEARIPPTDITGLGDGIVKRSFTYETAMKTISNKI